MNPATFPVMGQGDRDFEGVVVPAWVPWSLVEQYEKQAQANHGQSLKGLASRGGLSPCELVAVLECRRWRAMLPQDSAARLFELIKQHEAPNNELAAAQRQLAEAREECARLTALINTPRVYNFLEAVRVEAAHQQERWGSDHAAGKLDADWFWLIGWLAGKAVHAKDDEKRLHHIITTAAACLNWHAHRLGEGRMRPGIIGPEKEPQS